MNVYPVEIEEVLYTMGGIQDAAVIGVPDQEWGEAVKAVVVLQDGARISEAQVIEFCKARLAGFKVPKSVDFCLGYPQAAHGGKSLNGSLGKHTGKGRRLRSPEQFIHQPESDMSENPLFHLMSPFSIATFGAGNNFMKMGTMQALSIVKDGYKGKVYPVHPREKQVMGLKAYAGVEDLPEPPGSRLSGGPFKPGGPHYGSLRKKGNKKRHRHHCGVRGGRYRRAEDAGPAQQRLKKIRHPVPGAQLHGNHQQRDFP